MSNPDTLHVSADADPGGDGSAGRPLRRINDAAARAYPGHTVLVHGGTYREWVNPVRGGTGDSERIVYAAAGDEHVVIKGSEPVAEWSPVEGRVWRTELADEMFDGVNPFRERLGGDWFIDQGRAHRLGDVYLDGQSLFEAETREAVFEPRPWPQASDPDRALLCWFAEEREGHVTLFANFGDRDPREALVEVSARPACFYPRESGVNYITVRGFEMCHAACGWPPPTADQPGLLGPHWSKGWVIEDNHIHDARCCGISLGKDASTGHNEWSVDGRKHGTQREREVIFRALNAGWSRETVGSHIVRRNEIHDCEQAGICGHLGAIFSEVTDNHIHDIHCKALFSGYEIAGIKFHAAIDTLIARNRIHGCRRGMWMDWQLQGSRITANLMYDNGWEDLYVEVSHGPYVVDNNILLSHLAVKDWSQGGAYAHNLIAGRVEQRGVPNRFTPYHVPHGTAVAGLMTVLGGDTRYYNNLFVGLAEPEGRGAASSSVDESADLKNGERRARPTVGTAAYDAFPPANETPWQAARSVDDYAAVKLPVAIAHNVYCNGARPYARETSPVNCPDAKPSPVLEEEAGKVSLSILLDAAAANAAGIPVDGNLLGRAFQSEAPFESPDGSPLAVDTDYHGQPRGPAPKPGPFEPVAAGRRKFVVWPHAQG